MVCKDLVMKFDFARKIIWVDVEKKGSQDNPMGDVDLSSAPVQWHRRIGERLREIEKGFANAKGD